VIYLDRFIERLIGCNSLRNNQLKLVAVISLRARIPQLA